MANPALAELREIGGRAFVEELVETFATSATRCLERIHAGTNGGDVSDATKAMHTLAGAAGQLGEAGLEALARETEQLLREGGRIEAARLATLEQAAQRAVASLRAAARE